MAVINGLGINYNYNSSGATPSTDIPMLASTGFRVIRLFLFSYTSSSQQSDWRTILDIARAQSQFTRIVCGVSVGSNTLTSSTWAAYSTFVQAEATYVAGLGDSRIEFQLGNELELHHDGTITDATMRSNIRTLATAIIGTNPTLPISYSSSLSTGSEITNWASEGKGNLTRIGFNLYDKKSIFATNAAAIVSNFGSSGFVSEWGTNNGYSDYSDENKYLTAMTERRNILSTAGLGEFHMYNFMGPDDTKWGAWLNAGGTRLVWPMLIGSVGIAKL